MSKPLDFTKVEALRSHMLLSRGDMAKVLGVSRMTYYSWVGGSHLRKRNEAHVRASLKKLLAVVTDHGWPTPEANAMQPRYRFERLRTLLESYEDQGA